MLYIYMHVHAHESCMHVAVRVLHFSAVIICIRSSRENHSFAHVMIVLSVSFRGGALGFPPPPKILRNFSIIYNTK